MKINMKKKILPLLFVVLAAIAVYLLFFKKPTSEQRTNLYTLNDTLAINKIILNTPQNLGVSLYRSDTGWVLNAKLKADPNLVNQLIKTAQRLKVSYTLNEKESKSVIAEVKKDGSQVSYFDKNNVLLKRYWVGRAAANNVGSYFWDGTSAVAQVCYLPNLNGFLDFRFNVNEAEWRDRTIFNTNLDMIKSLTVDYIGLPQHSFHIEVHQQDSFSLTQLHANKPISLGPINRQRVFQYLSFYKRISSEGFNNDNPKRDSVLQSVPFCTVSLTDFNNKTTYVALHQRPLNKRSKARENALGQSLEYDVDRYWADINNGADLVVVQQFVFGKLLRRFDEFYNR